VTQVTVPKNSERKGAVLGKRNVTIRDLEGRKFCYKCRAYLNPNRFGPSKIEADGLNANCERCILAPRLVAYGITWEQYDVMWQAQGRACAICKQPPGRRPDVDHDHACCPGTGSCGKCVRGLLCFNCNSAIGKFKDNIDTIKSAVTYITQSRGNI